MRKSFMTQKWSELIMLHWPVPERKVSETTPEDLRPDLYDGQAWASVVVFKLSNLRVFPIRFLKWGSFSRSTCVPTLGTKRAEEAFGFIL